MTTKTDYHAILELRESYTPQAHGFVTKEEREKITQILELKSRSDIELQNIRDMSVMVYQQFVDCAQANNLVEKVLQEMDKISAICHVIDLEKVERGLEV